MQGKGLSGDDHMISPEMAEVSKWGGGVKDRKKEKEREGGREGDFII